MQKVCNGTSAMALSFARFDEDPDDAAQDPCKTPEVDGMQSLTKSVHC
jgi:hypothetical protein